ncbi:hypothetical protein DFH07DRAFT_940305 [Mycena maculata]|uniref:Uncharacterized protein n=1 Tax=Mycena maculata TaxID=230809 RepID=A0AAD7J7R3_9AGAR|nr:hypothetical protein DFH07DRAFT_940305 [Mycena maculata]
MPSDFTITWNFVWLIDTDTLRSSLTKGSPTKAGSHDGSCDCEDAALNIKCLTLPPRILLLRRGLVLDAAAEGPYLRLPFLNHTLQTTGLRVLRPEYPPAPPASHPPVTPSDHSAPIALRTVFEHDACTSRAPAGSDAADLGPHRRRERRYAPQSRISKQLRSLPDVPRDVVEPIKPHAQLLSQRAPKRLAEAHVEDGLEEREHDGMVALAHIDPRHCPRSPPSADGMSRILMSTSMPWGGILSARSHEVSLFTLKLCT